MTPQERDLITTLLDRLRSAGAAGQQKDAEADALIRQALREQPDMAYYLVQTVLIQDFSLNEAQHRIADLEQQLSEGQSQQSSGTSFLGGLFGRNEPQRQPDRPQPDRPQPWGSQPGGPWSRSRQVGAPQQYAQGPGGYGRPGYGQPRSHPPQGPQAQQQQPGGMPGGGGGGFLRSAAATAAGVAGGALLFQGISSMFGSGYANSLYSGGGANLGLGETVAHNADSGGDYGGNPGYTGGGPDYTDSGDYGGGGDYDGGDYDGGDYADSGDYGESDFGGDDFGSEDV